MNILLLGPVSKDITRLQSYSSVCAYYICKYFDRHAISYNVHHMDTRRISILPLAQQLDYFAQLNLSGVDHILGLGIRFFSFFRPEVAAFLKRNISGKLCQIYDSGRSLDPCDINFSMSLNHLGNKDVYVNWGADPELCRPKQDNHDLHILIDHPAYSPRSVDLSDNIATQVSELIDSNAYKSKYERIVVRRFISNGIEDFTPTSHIAHSYNRKGVSYCNACEEYGQAHIFLVTHQEPLGFSIIESAYSGALIVAPRHFAKRDRLDTVRHYEYDGTIDWPVVIDMIDVNASIAMTQQLTWENIVTRMIAALQ